MTLFDEMHDSGIMAVIDVGMLERQINVQIDMILMRRERDVMVRGVAGGTPAAFIQTAQSLQRHSETMGTG